ncbi:hypothetical protein ABIB25_000648 [Nakamurella sp. UYEF19]
MLKCVSNQDIPRYVTTRSYGRAWQLAIIMLILAIYFTIKAVQHLASGSAGAWFYVPAASLGIAALAQCLRNAVWLHRHPSSRRS